MLSHSSPEKRNGLFKTILEPMADEVVLGDGGYLIELERCMYVRGDYWVPEVVLDHPKVVERMHKVFIRAGSEAIQGLTFWTSRNFLDEQAGRGGEVEQINRQAVRIAKSAAVDLDVSNIGVCCGAGPSAIRGLPDGMGKPTWVTNEHN